LLADGARGAGLLHFSALHLTQAAELAMRLHVEFAFEDVVMVVMVILFVMLVVLVMSAIVVLVAVVFVIVPVVIAILVMISIVEVDISLLHVHGVHHAESSNFQPLGI
jgi:hypothetical protein